MVYSDTLFDCDIYNFESLPPERMTRLYQPKNFF